MKFKKLGLALSLFSAGVLACSPGDMKHNMSMSTDNQVDLVSMYGFRDTVKKLKTAFEEKGLKIFDVIDHQRAAKKVGLTMQPAKVLIYGNPAVGTQYMVKDPTFALQLPLKVLVTEVDGKVRVIYNTTKFLVQNSTVLKSEDLANTLAKVENLIPNVISDPNKANMNMGSCSKESKAKKSKKKK